MNDIGRHRKELGELGIGNLKISKKLRFMEKNN